QLLFTSAESILIFNPSLAQRKNSAGTVFITDLKLMNQSLSVDSLLQLNQISLSHNNTNLAIEFSALNFNRLNKLDYYYQLENFDSTWIKSDNRHQAIYTTLPPGTYKFKVYTRSIGGVTSAEAAILSIRVYPPFWKTWWFFMAVLAIVAAVLYVLYRERIQRLVTLYNIRTDIANHLHQDVSTTLNNINVLSQIAKLKADKDINRSKEIIDEISGKSYDMMLSMDEILWSIDPGNDTMEKTLQRLFEFAKMLEAGYDASIDIIVHEKVKHLRLNMKMRHDFFIVCKEVLQYMAHYAKEKNLMVDIDFAWSKILLKILCVDAEIDGNSMKVLELKKNLTCRAEAMQANLAFEVGKKEASVILSIPVKSYSFLPNSFFRNRKQ
ncbi:MAG TPA: triple tyrosine motif-containing protein, partial [Flavisolibacter sp.]|nr:triple tyrosine motif-containing protein [Flavisolibacter sp.]